MTKTKLFTLALTFIGINSFAQITVTDADLIDVGDIIYQASDTVPGSTITPGNTGANQTWDFSSLQVQNTVTSQCVSPNGTPHALSYPNANLCIEESGDYSYFNKSSTKVEFLGEGDSVFQQPLVVLPLPLTYGSTYTDGPIAIFDSVISGPIVALGLAAQGVTAAMLSQGAAHTTDTINIQVNMLTEFNVDAWGSLTIPMDTFDCLRLKIEITSNAQIQIYCTDTTMGGSGSGWYPFTAPDYEQETSYQWWSDNTSTKFALVDMPVDSLDNANEVTFLHNSAASINNAKVPAVRIYPVPATYNLNIEIKDARATYKMYDIGGNMILESNFNNSTKVDLSNIAKGTYLLNISTETGSITKKIIVE